MKTLPRPWSRPRLVPDPIDSESNHARFRHQDVPTLRGSLIGAERHLLAQRLAWAVYRRRPDRLLFIEEDGRPVGEREWLADRIERLDAERRRRDGVGAHAL